MLALLVTAGCEAPRPAPNLVLIVVDTLGAESVGHLGAGAKATPEIDLLAARGITFENAYAAAPWTQPSVASLLTGRMPRRHGVTRLFDALADDERSLAETLSEGGWATSAVVSHELLAARYGFDQGFAAFDSTAARGHRAVTSRRVTGSALAWLDERPADHPFFLLVHYFDPHYVYRHHRRFDRTAGYAGDLEPGMGIWRLREARDAMSEADTEYLRGLYREEVAFTDAAVGELLAGLEQRGLTDGTVVALTADHGEEILRHGWIGHTRTLYDELLRVPLILAGPGVGAALRVEAPVSLVDLAPTLLELVGADAPASTAEIDGRSLAAALGGGEAIETRDVFAEVSFSMEQGAPAKRAEKVAFKTAVVRGRHKLIHDLLSGTWQLFDLEVDPEELDPLDLESSPREGSAGSGAAVARDLRRALEAWEESASRPAGDGPSVLPSAAELDRLRSLGYIDD